MRPKRIGQYLAGDAEPLALKRGNGTSQADERKRMTAWLVARGEVSGWRRIIVKKPVISS